MEDAKTLLSPLERRFLAFYAEEGYQYNTTVRRMYPRKSKDWSDNRARQTGFRIMQRIRAKLGKDGLTALLDAEGLPMSRVLETYRNCLDATFVKPLSTKFGVVECGPYVDHRIRKDTADTLAELHGVKGKAGVLEVKGSGPGGALIVKWQDPDPLPLPPQASQEPAGGAIVASPEGSPLPPGEEPVEAVEVKFQGE